MHVRKLAILRTINVLTEHVGESPSCVACMGIENISTEQPAPSILTMKRKEPDEDSRLRKTK